ncbi:F0F1 ATP synthase subunit A [Ureaplasma miroungigenitalium]|uniref:F0F1 ATP synthase subunit A n=1 Tax=Ureaplasma miroungigenitalium TaxID=1042321 RepID=A0ABT3BNE8_9BACT|nr:F0F1 ATP synthase subunit A [Ureaplasma miroungigenitalium]MCV3728616.1 F0F1 ATP synthase subunit A [Ureaplasma miroungigenitalium]MCV3734308.1 F0F1 ATP synthase subunit A [Ureaplasma miroungigenitalium]
MENYKPLDVLVAVPHIGAVIMVTLIILTISLVYYFNVRKLKVHDVPNRFVLIIQAIVNYFKGIVVDTMGPKHVKLAPWILFTFVYIFTANMVSLFGFKEATTALSVPLGMAIASVFGGQIVALRYQKASFFLKFAFKIKGIPVMINPLEIVSKFSPIISLTFRLWGNITAAAILLNITFWAFAGFTDAYPFIGLSIIAAVTILPILIGYFTMFAGTIQAFVFTLLTSVTWGLEIKEGEEHFEHLAHKKAEKEAAKRALEASANQPVEQQVAVQANAVA